MATVNERVGVIQASVINGIDAGGTMSARIEAGYDEIIESEPDGLEVPISDRGAQFVRGTVVTQDWVKAVELLTGTVGSYCFSERQSGVAVDTGYIKHTITNPVIHNVRLDFNKGGYATAAFDFECRAADDAKTIADMWGMLDDQAAPTYVAAARGGWRVQSTPEHLSRNGLFLRPQARLSQGLQRRRRGLYLRRRPLRRGPAHRLDNLPGLVHHYREAEGPGPRLSRPGHPGGNRNPVRRRDGEDDNYRRGSLRFLRLQRRVEREVHRLYNAIQSNQRYDYPTHLGR